MKAYKMLPCFIVVFLLSLYIAADLKYDASDNPFHNKTIFKEVERIKLKTGKLNMASISIVRVLPDGFVLIINESAYADKYALVKLSKKGEFISKYDKRGNGPGELRVVTNLCVTDNSILAAERSAPFVHEFSHDLDFKKDYRLKRGGKIFAIGSNMGIWTPFHDNDKIYMLALYNSDFVFKKMAFEIDEIPAFVQGWGGIIKVDANTYAGVYPTGYQIRLFDKNMNFKKNMIKKTPGHIIKYTPWNKSPFKLDNAGAKWIWSWSKVHSVFYIKGIFVIKHTREKQRFLDFIDKSGDIIYAGYKEDEFSTHIFTTAENTWKLEWNEDRTEFYLIKEQFNLSYINGRQ